MKQTNKLDVDNIPDNFKQDVGDTNFFFSSRIRHTRLSGDWSSDVCSSDLRSALNLSRAPAHDDEVESIWQVIFARVEDRLVAWRIVGLQEVEQDGALGHAKFSGDVCRGIDGQNTCHPVLDDLPKVGPEYVIQGYIFRRHERGSLWVSDQRLWQSEERRVGKECRSR